MFIDYVTLLLINTAAAMFILACYVQWGLDDADQQRWAPAFAVPAFILTVSGLHMVWNWPLPGPYSSAFGEMSVVFGVLLGGAALALWKGWSLVPVSIYALWGGLLSLVAGVRFINLHLTQLPALTGVGFIVTGIAGVFALPLLHLRKNKTLRTAGALLLALSSAIWTFIWLGGFWMHMQGFAKWLPPTMK